MEEGEDPGRRVIGGVDRDKRGEVVPRGEAADALFAEAELEYDDANVLQGRAPPTERIAGAVPVQLRLDRYGEQFAELLNDRLGCSPGRRSGQCHRLCARVLLNPGEKILQAARPSNPADLVLAQAVVAQPGGVPEAGWNGTAGRRFGQEEDRARPLEHLCELREIAATGQCSPHAPRTPPRPG